MQFFNAAVVTVAFLLGVTAGIWWIRGKPQDASSPAAGTTPKLTLPTGQPAIGFLNVVEGKPIVRAKAGADVLVSGWAACTEHQSPLVTVEILVDKRAVAAAALAFARPDVAETYGRPDFQNSGWKSSFSPRNIAEGNHELTARATCASGESSLLPPFTLVVIR